VRALRDWNAGRSPAAHHFRPGYGHKDHRITTRLLPSAGVVGGFDVGGNRVLDETLTREEALRAHTRSNAHLFFQEKALGSLEVGWCSAGQSSGSRAQRRARNDFQHCFRYPKYTMAKGEPKCPQPIAHC
jgi:hypothetical protein